MNKERWKSLLANNHHSVFQTNEWIDILSEDGWHPVYLVNKDFTGGMVFMENKTKDAYEGLRLGCYGGVIGNMVNVCELMSTSIRYIRIVDYPDTLHLDGWDKTYISTFLVDLQKINLSHGRTSDLNKAKKNGISVKETTDLETFYSVYLSGMDRFPGTVDVKSIEFFSKIMKSGLAKFHLAFKDNKPVGCTIHLYYKDKIFSYIGLATSTYRNLGVLTAIYDYIINNSSGYATYNFGAAVSETQKWFKESFGAIEYRYPIYGLVFNYKYQTI